MKKVVYLFIIIFLVVLVPYMYWKIERKLLYAQTYAGISSIEAALINEFKNNNKCVELFFKCNNSRINTKKYYELIDFLSQKNNLDIPKNYLDPFGSPYIIDYQVKKNNLLIHVHSKNIKEKFDKHKYIVIKGFLGIH